MLTMLLCIFLEHCYYRVNFILFSSNNSLAEINIIVVLYNVCGFVLNMYILFMSGFSGERKRGKKKREEKWGMEGEGEKNEKSEKKGRKRKEMGERNSPPTF